jgi:hypothetical protein
MSISYLPQNKVIFLHHKLISPAPFYCWVLAGPFGSRICSGTSSRTLCKSGSQPRLIAGRTATPARALSSRQLTFNHLALLLLPDGRVPFLRFTDISTGLSIPIVLVAVLLCPLFFTYSPCFEHNCSGKQLELQELRRSQLPPDQGHQYVPSD